jgi:uncharacterized membrane protein YozB (DUF420 family)
MNYQHLPLLNASLNATAAVLLAAAYVSIRRRKIRSHALLMIAALAVSAAFLTSYTIYHVAKQHATGAGHTTFAGTGLIRPVYFSILITHIVLAAAIVPLVLVTVTRAARRRFDLHARIARITLPIWFYVSVTGVVVYLLLYQVYPSA